MDDDALRVAAHRWQGEGWVLVPGLIPTDVIDDAVHDLWEHFPQPKVFHRRDPQGSDSRQAFGARTDIRKLVRAEVEAEGAAFRDEQFLGREPFPWSGSGRLNRLVVHPSLVRFAQLALDEHDLRLYQLGLWAKYTGVTNYEQPLHADLNHSVVPPRMEPGWWHLEGFLYLSDVHEGVAPTRLVGRGQAGSLRAVDQGPDVQRLMEHEVSAPGPRGSFLAYRPDVFHRGVDLTEPGGARFLASISFRPAAVEFVQYDVVQPRVPLNQWRRFVAGCTPEELALFGVPRPGHDYWTADMVDQMAVLHPGLDVEPWRRQLGAPSTTDNDPGPGGDRPRHRRGGRGDREGPGARDNVVRRWAGKARRRRRRGWRR